jgi:hypothetical protein
MTITGAQLKAARLVGAKTSDKIETHAGESRRQWALQKVGLAVSKCID